MSGKGKARESLLAAATQLFHIQGYHATGLNQILKESGAPKGSLYYHFPNGKEQLAIEAVNTMSEFILQDSKQQLEQHVDATGAFQALIRNIGNHFNDIENLSGVPIGLLAAETSLKSEPLRMACKQAFESWEFVYRDKLERCGFEATQASHLAIVVNAMIEGAITRSLTNKNGDSLFHVAECIPVLFKKE